MQTRGILHNSHKLGPRRQNPLYSMHHTVSVSWSTYWLHTCSLVLTAGTLVGRSWLALNEEFPDCPGSLHPGLSHNFCSRCLVIYDDLCQPWEGKARGWLSSTVPISPSWKDNHNVCLKVLLVASKKELKLAFLLVLPSLCSTDHPYNYIFHIFTVFQHVVTMPTRNGYNCSKLGIVTIISTSYPIPYLS